MAANRLEPPDRYDQAHRACWANAVALLTANGNLFRTHPEILAAYVEAAVALGLDTGGPIAETALGVPIAQPRWCEEHKRPECRHNRQDGQHCHQWRLIAGLDVCRKHGGKTIEALRADGAQRAAQEKAARELARLDVAPVVNPLDELYRVAGQCVAWKDGMAVKVNELTQLRYRGGQGTEQLRAELLLWERALDRCVITLSTMARLNLDARLAGVRKATALMLEEALVMALQKSGADVYGQDAAREEFTRRLKVVGE